MRSYKLILAVVAATLMAAGCSQQKQNATKVLEGVETKLATIKADAERYAPEGLRASNRSSSACTPASTTRNTTT